MENYHGLALINPSITGWHVRVKVVRSFTVRLAPPRKALGLILANEEGMLIEAVVGYKFADFYDEYIEEGEWLTINHFGVALNSSSLKATSHAFKIYFLEYTVVRKIVDYPVNPPRRFASFSSIFGNVIDTSVLVDLVGAIYEVGVLENVASNPNDVNGMRISFKLRNKDNEVLECLAVKREALEFDRNYHMLGGGVIVAVLGWWKVDRYFDGPKNVRICSSGPVSTVYPEPEIPEADDIREMLAMNNV